MTLSGLQFEGRGLGLVFRVYGGVQAVGSRISALV